ncbi:MAG: HAMP domain-containing histidine kinase [Magnetococcales bacterium]|nr:HAMP domain-containing histidine kinase [Magnetococcales bacterium]
MSTLNDDELIDELKQRFDATKQALYDVKMVTNKLEEVNKKLQASEQVKSNFVSHMKNEINNPLTSILGLTVQIKTGNLDQETIQSVATMIHGEAFSLDFQLRNIFAAAELESGETEIQVSLVDVHNLIKDAVDTFQHLIDEKQLKVLFTPQPADGEGLRIKTDTEKLSLVVHNLLSNAIEFNREGGTITIDAKMLEGRLSLSFTDTGAGLEPDQLHKIFDRFSQLEVGYRKSHKGHGLGLSITQAIVDLMEGEVIVDSTKERGSTFTILLPEMVADVDADAFSVDGSDFFFDDDSGAEAF